MTNTNMTRTNRAGNPADNVAPNRARRLGGLTAALSAVIVAMLAFPLNGSAQCIMCSLSLTSTGEHGAHVFQLAILAAAAPIFLMFGGIMLVAYLRRNPVEPVNEDAIDELQETEVPAGFPLEATALAQPSHQQN